MSGLNPKKTVVPVDFSDLSFDALRRAVEIAGDASKVSVIHVLTPMVGLETETLYGSVTEESRIESARSHLDQVLASPEYEGIVSHIAIGDPGHEIASYAEKEQAELIVLPSHGHGFLRHLLLGSTAERVVRLAHCPVLVLRS